MSGPVRALAKIAMAAACVAALFPGLLRAETLRSLIEKSPTPPDVRALADPDRNVSNYAVLDTSKWFAVAYFVPGDSQALEGPLFVDRYDRAGRQWRRASFSRDETAAGASDCLGPALDISVSGDSLLLTTHLSPSAECVLVLSTDLGIRTKLYGWPLATLADGSIVYHRSQIHFAPVHAAEIAVYNRKTGRSYTIYPSKPYQAVRRAEIAKLTEFFDAHLDWCNQHNQPCDPELFDNALRGSVAVNNQADALAFVIDYGSDADDPNAPPVTIGHRQAVYVFRYVSNEFGFQYREMPLGEVERRFGKGALPQLLSPASLRAIFAIPAGQ